MIIPIEESEWVYQVLRYIHSPAFFIQRANSDFETEKKWTYLWYVLDRLKI